MGMRPCDARNGNGGGKRLREAAETVFQPSAENAEKGRYVAVESHGVTISATKINKNLLLSSFF